MKIIEPIHATVYLRTADLGFVKRFHDKASAKLGTINLESLGVPGLKNDFKFAPYQTTLPAGGSPAGSERGIMDWVDAVEAPAAGDKEHMRLAKIRDIDKLGRLIAVAAIRLETEVSPATPTLSEMAAGGVAAESFEQQVSQAVDGEQAGDGPGEGQQSGGEQSQSSEVAPVAETQSPNTPPAPIGQAAAAPVTSPPAAESPAADGSAAPPAPEFK